MPRPTTKKALQTAAQTRFDELFALINSMPASEQEADFTFSLTEKDKEAHWQRDKNLRDILVHLYEWHRLLINWVEENSSGGGEIVTFLLCPYTWKNYGGMNIAFWEKHRSTSLSDSISLLIKSHAEVMALIKGFSDEELFTKAFFNWSGTTSVGSYIVSSTSSHYEWAIKKLKRQIKAVK